MNSEAIILALIEQSKFIVPVITFIFGFFVSRWTLSKKDRIDIEQTKFETAKELMKERAERFQLFAVALNKYASKVDEPSINDFFNISTTGESYFYQLKITCDAILSDKVDKVSRDKTLLPGVSLNKRQKCPIGFFMHLPCTSPSSSSSCGDSLQLCDNAVR